MNIMCTFSPDDRRLLCSGAESVDTGTQGGSIVQFELPSFRQAPQSFPVRPAAPSRAHYRRSFFFFGGGNFVTTATPESHVRVLSAEGSNLGVVDFRGLLSSLA